MHACMHARRLRLLLNRADDRATHGARARRGPSRPPNPADFPHAAEPPQHPAPIALQISNGNWECVHARCQIKAGTGIPGRTVQVHQHLYTRHHNLDGTKKHHSSRSNTLTRSTSKLYVLTHRQHVTFLIYSKKTRTSTQCTQRRHDTGGHTTLSTSKKTFR